MIVLHNVVAIAIACKAVRRKSGRVRGSAAFNHLTKVDHWEAITAVSVAASARRRRQRSIVVRVVARRTMPRLISDREVVQASLVWKAGCTQDVLRRRFLVANALTAAAPPTLEPVGDRTGDGDRKLRALAQIIG